MKIKLNRALPVSYDVTNRKLVVGQTYLDMIEIEDSPEFINDLLRELNVEQEIDEILIKYRSVAQEYFYKIEDVISSLLDEKIITYTWQPDRYDRHRLFFELANIDNDAAMTALSQATVGIMGTGGIGSNVATLLAASGIGRLKVSDGDLIEETNLTRATIFKEEQIGTRKVDSLKLNISERNRKCKVETLPLLLSEENLEEFIAFFSECDVIVLSADPQNAFELVGKLHQSQNVPIVNAGYLGRLGLVGPMLDSQSKPGFEELFMQDIEKRLSGKTSLNENYQAPSYGPLNYMVSSICSHEVIRFIITGDCAVKSKRLYINPDDYETLFYDYNEQNNLPEHIARVNQPGDKDVFDKIADNYKSFREVSSLNKVILDERVSSLLKSRRYDSVLDVGCGLGTYCRMLTGNANSIIGLDTNESMLSAARELGEAIEYVSDDFLSYNPGKKFDLIIFSLVLDHVADFESYISKAKELINPGGYILCITPSSLKDSCFRDEDGNYIVQDYFYEGLQTKNRYDPNGEFLFEVVSFKRNLSSYINSFIKKGFNLLSIEEPQHPDSGNSASLLPYFTIIELRYEH